MYCPQCGHKQVSTDTRFCARCGIALGIAAELIAGGSGHLQREKREMAGVGFTIATVIMLFNFLLVYGLITLPHIGNPVFFWIWLSFVLASLLVGVLGLTQLIRGGFFKRLKERELQLQVMNAVQERQAFSPPTETAGELSSGSSDYISVTEPTTRKLTSDKLKE